MKQTILSLVFCLSTMMSVISPGSLSFSIQCLDGETDDLLHGATWYLVGMEDKSEHIAEYHDGVATFTHLDSGVNYKLKQVLANDGYIPDITEYNVWFDKDGKMTISPQPSIEDGVVTVTNSYPTSERILELKKKDWGESEQIYNYPIFWILSTLTLILATLFLISTIRKDCKNHK